jgi:hypothetical protein
MTRARTPPPRRRWRWLLPLGGVLLLTVVVSGLLLAACRPAWYEPTAIDYNLLRSDKQVLSDLADRIGHDLNAGRPTRFTISAAELHRWVTARHELWPDEIRDPAGLEQPVVRLEDGRLRAGARVASSGWRGVASVAARIAVSPEVVAVRLRAPRIGRLPLPAGCCGARSSGWWADGRI